MKRSLQRNPDNRPASMEQIRDWRDYHEASPINTTHGTLDCDSKADKRLYEQLDLFGYLDTLNPDGTLSWKMADNTWQAFTKNELADAYNQVRINRAQRAGLLHVKAAEFEAMTPMPTVNELKDISFWLQ